MMNEAKMNELTQAEDMAYFRADLCCYSPESWVTYNFLRTLTAE